MKNGIFINAIIVAGGKSQRAKVDKLSLCLGNESVLQRTISKFLSIDYIDRIIVVGNRADIDFSDVKVINVCGGETRAKSVQNGLEVAKNGLVLIHDGARPFVSKSLIESLVDKALTTRSAIPCISVTDSIREIENGKIVGFPKRQRLVAVQTPQVFYKEDIEKAYREFRGDSTDDCEVYASLFGPVSVVDGDVENIKITTKEDVLGIVSIIGNGYDLHRLGANKPLMVLGVEVKESDGAVAFSDGDCALHALTDAILSALGEGDIGRLFPDDDIRYKDADSLKLFATVIDMVRARGRELRSLSVVVKLDKPKLSPFVNQMIANIKKVTSLDESCIGITFKTSEKTAVETIEAWAIATII